MAEILISLTIIGVVAAVTLPSLTGNINEKTWNTQRKALYARMSQAIKLMPTLSGYGELEGSVASGSTPAVTTKDTAAEAFVTQGLSKVMKINHFCDNNHISECGIPKQIIPLGGGTPIQTEDIKTLGSLNPLFLGVKDGSGRYKTGLEYSFNGTYYYLGLDTKAVAIETGNGESMLVYYNPKCQTDMNETSLYYIQPKMCANFIYDLNGKKGPNTVGKDVGVITALYATDSKVVAPMPLTKDASSGSMNVLNAKKACATQDPDSDLPNRSELASLFYNQSLFGIIVENLSYWSGTSNNVRGLWYLNINTGKCAGGSGAEICKVRCVKRD